MACVLHFGPRVPDSSSGFLKYTQRESTYRRAATLSSAFMTMSKDPQKGSLKTVSVSGETLFCNALGLKSGLREVAAAPPTDALDLQDGSKGQVFKNVRSVYYYPSSICNMQNVIGARQPG